MLQPTQQETPQVPFVLRGERAPEATPETRSFENFLSTARKRFQMAEAAEQKIREAALEDLKFYVGKQWPSDIESDRLQQGKPCLTINRLPPIAKQVINAQRQSKPSIVISPVGDGADVETAEVIQGLIRHIEIASNADIAYDTGFEQMVIGGFGYWRVVSEWVEGEVYQELRIKRILNPFSVYYDPRAKEPDYSDAKYCFIVSDIDQDDFKADFPNSRFAQGLSEFRGTGDNDADWFPAQKIRLAEYYWVEEQTRLRVVLSDGRTAFHDEIPDDAEVELRNGKPISRKEKVRIVHWCKMNAQEVLVETTVPGPLIPVIPVLGDEIIVEGERKLIGMVRNAKDGQRFFNYAQTGVVEQIALASKAPMMADAEAIEGYEDDYQTAHIKNPSVLRWKSRGSGGRTLERPTRDVYEPPIQALTQLLTQSDNNIKATIGLYDASLGQRGPDESGKAILARKAEGDEATFHLTDNQARAIRYTAKVILGQIPTIYDNARIQRITDPDGSHKLAPLNQHFITMPDGSHRVVQGPVYGEDGGAKSKIFDVTKGRYDVVISVGPSYHSRRQEFVESVLSMVQAAPQLMAFVMDLLVRNMDWPGAQEIADRLKKMLPPQLQDEQEQQQIPPAVQAKLTSLMQLNAELIKRLNAATSVQEGKRLEAESRERIALLNAEAGILKAEIASKSAAAQTLVELDHDGVKHQLDLRAKLLHVDQTVESDAAPDQPPQGAPAAPPYGAGPFRSPEMQPKQFGEPPVDNGGTA